MLIINKDDINRIQIWTKKTICSKLPIHLLQFKQIQDISFQILLLKHVYIIIKIKQTSIKAEEQMSKRKYSIHKYFVHTELHIKAPHTTTTHQKVNIEAH